ncbi:ABC-F family ATP-binding cassette domain-containing protein [Moheibacter lacus]|uniref:ABC-F family ATP-binding cassette domain-containing protein n=1 Tax=Moheibacter lacus TaxID=2745851 RepID=A0A838ZSC7_9FLAO|nr:ABC-F family ATP-binding cassette domain-containing protein [Moheibacter lacus]MBA5629429.1 ABC-F family ATP-binding cassette domain-containing protein [Moheibacter lacus]
MNYLSANSLSKSYGIRTLFREVSFHVNEGDQIALVAKNGSGKSTLLKILAGKETSDSGEILFNKDVKVLLFEQTDDFNEALNASDYIFNHSNSVLDVIRKYEELMLKNPFDPKLMDLMEKMNQLDAWKVESTIQEILSKLKIDFLHQKIGELSGGQRKRISLAKFLIDISLESGHLLLILDEPTNHLDIEMVEWLEFFLNKENKTMILVTHDRYFLDAICTKIIELEGGQTYVHNGDYETYVNNKAIRIENQTAEIGKAQNLYRKELEWMRRQPKARTTKSKSRIDDFYDTKEKAHQKIDKSEVKLDMQMTRLGKKIIEMKEVSKRFGEKIILDNFSHFFGRGNKIGIIGKNGVGKTTFLKIIEGIETVDSGEIEIGETLKIGHFKQDGIDFKEDQRAIDFVKDLAESFPLSNGKQLSASQFMELFLFSPEQQYTPIQKLSGGEKKRLQLLAVLFQNPNFLILDEPTNDLDLPTLTVLENFLRDFQGCLLIVSHDRYFMDKVVDEMMVFEGDGKINWFLGNYTEYFLIQKELEETKKIQEKPKEKIQETSKANAKKVSFKEKREFETLEKEIPKLQELKENLTDKLSQPDLDFEELQKISLELEKTIEKLDEKEMRWLELSLLTED